MAYNTIVVAEPNSRTIDSMRRAACRHNGVAATVDLTTTNLDNRVEEHVLRTDLDNRVDVYEHVSMFLQNANELSPLALRQARNWVANYCAQNPKADLKFIWVIDPSVLAEDVAGIYAELSALLTEPISDIDEDDDQRLEDPQGLSETVVEALDAIDSSDPEVAHSKADALILALLPENVANAYERLVTRSRWWNC